MNNIAFVYIGYLFSWKTILKCCSVSTWVQGTTWPSSKGIISSLRLRIKKSLPVRGYRLRWVINYVCKYSSIALKIMLCTKGNMNKGSASAPLIPFMFKSVRLNSLYAGEAYTYFMKYVMFIDE